MSVCIRYVDIKYPTCIHIIASFICFISSQINLIVLQYLNHYEVSLQSRRSTIASKPSSPRCVSIRQSVNVLLTYNIQLFLNLAFICFILPHEISLTLLQ